MKLAPLFAQFLYSNKKLSLPGIGVFHLDPSAYIEIDNPKSTIPEGSITFERDLDAKSEADLVEFIAKETGKMKSLAISDISSFVELMQQFLNIGKPFLMEGIGTLVKNSNGKYDFTMGLPLKERITESAGNDAGFDTTADPAITFKGMYKKQERAGFTLTKAFIALLLFAGLGVAVWGGYALYSKNKNAAASKAATSVPETIIPINDDNLNNADTIVNKPDSLTKPEVAVTVKPGYKFIFETTPNKNRAIKRYAFVKNINSQIQLETKDSTVFDITVNMNIPATDTIRIKDSLNAWYWGKKDILVKIAPNTTSNVP